MKFSILDTVPFVTTKKLFYNSVIRELLFFISGKTDTKILEEQKVKIWVENTTKKFLQERNLPYREGDMGPGYGHQMRHYGAEYKGCDADYTGQGIDQLAEVIKLIRTDPFSRRIILCLWNPAQNDDCALPPCHVMAQFYVSADRKYLDCMLTQRSGDFFLGVPFNIASYAILTHCIAHICNLRARTLTHSIGDAHIYSNHNQLVERQLARTPRPFPILRFRQGHKIQEIDDFTFESFHVEGYDSWPPLLGDMAT